MRTIRNPAAVFAAFLCAHALAPVASAAGAEAPPNPAGEAKGPSAPVDAPAPAAGTEAPKPPEIPAPVRTSAGTVLRIQVRPHSFPELLNHSAFALENVPGLVTARGIIAGADEVFVVPPDAKPVRCEGFLSEDPRRGTATLDGPRLAPLALGPVPSPGDVLFLAEPGADPRPMKVARAVEASGGETLLVFAEPLSLSSLGAPLLADDGKVAALLVKSGEEPVGVPAEALSLPPPKDPKGVSFHRLDPDAPLRLYFRATILNALAYHEGALQALRYVRRKGNLFVDIEYGAALIGCGLEPEAIEAFTDVIHALGGAGAVGIGGRRKATGYSKEEETLLLAAAWRGLGRAQATLVNHREAAEAFRRAVALQPDRAENHLLLGQMLMAVQDYAGAEASLREAMRLSPDDPAPRCALATLLLILDRDKEAQALAKSSGALGADVQRRVQERISAKEQLEFMRVGLSQALRDMGLLYLNLRQPDRAVEMLAQSARGDPGNAETRVLLGGAHFEMGQFDAAVASIREALRLKPDYPEAWLNLGWVYQMQEQYDNALRAYAEALRRRPAYPEALMNRALCLRSQEQFDAAIKSFEEALKAKPDFIPAKASLAVTQILRGKKEEVGPALASLHEIDASLEILASDLLAKQEIVDRNPASPVAKIYLAMAYSSLGLWGRAVTAYQSANETDPAIPECHYGLGVAYWAQKRLSKALYEYGEAIRLRAGYADAHVGIGNVQMMFRQPQRAASAFATALRHAPDHPNALFGLGRARAREGRRQEAREILGRLRKADPVLAKALENFLIE